MDGRRSWIGWTVAVVALAGCGSSSSSPSAAPSAVPPPDQALFDFLEAVRVGDDEKAAGMLTDLAREKTAAMDLVVAPPGSPTASFEVGEVEIVEEGVAHVASSWTDVGDNGQPERNEILWVLSREPQGWRIAGMITKLFDNELPLILNFEDPEDMIRKQQLAEQEMMRRARAAAETANTQSGATGTGEASLK